MHAAYACTVMYCSAICRDPSVGNGELGLRCEWRWEQEEGTTSLLGMRLCVHIICARILCALIMCSVHAYCLYAW